eukprot:9703236-Ditylum_brightwellii.AAC.1
MQQQFKHLFEDVFPENNFVKTPMIFQTLSYNKVTQRKCNILMTFSAVSTVISMQSQTNFNNSLNCHNMNQNMTFFGPDTTKIQFTFSSNKLIIIHTLSAFTLRASSKMWAFYHSMTLSFILSQLIVVYQHIVSLHLHKESLI